MRWEKAILGDVTDSCLGKMLDQEKNRGTYQPYLANLNVRWGSFDLDDLPEMRFGDDEQERYGLEYGDLVICEGGEPGRCALWKNAVPNMKIQKALHRVRTHACLDNRYLYYWFLLAGKTGELDQYFTGATIKHMPGQKLKSVVIDMPPLETQRRIADILSAYDDLIENNQKQIKLLEEAAQRLYREWFVELRFPGHETTPVVEGIPEGWKKGNLSDIVVFKRGKVITEKECVAGSVPVVAGGLEPAYYHDTANTLAPVITVSGSGANAGFVRLYNENVFASDCSFVDSESSRYLYFVYEFLRNSAGEISAIRKGSAQPHVYAKDINALSLLLPKEAMLNIYVTNVKALFEKITVLEKTIKAAKETRDRLLPKLMSGEVEV